jgi:hypothetical protein
MSKFILTVYNDEALISVVSLVPPFSFFKLCQTPAPSAGTVLPNLAILRSFDSWSGFPGTARKGIQTKNYFLPQISHFKQYHSPLGGAYR